MAGIDDELVRLGDQMAADPEGVGMPGPHGYEHNWEYIGGPGLPAKSVVEKLPHTKGAVAEARTTQAPTQDPSARYQPDGKLRRKLADLKPKVRAVLAGARERDDLRSRPDGFKDQDRALPSLYTATGNIHDGTALYDAGLVDGTVKGVNSPTDRNGRKYVLNADGKRAAELAREPAAGRGAEQRVQADSGVEVSPPKGHQLGRELKISGLPEGVSVYASGDVLHNGTLVAKLSTGTRTEHVMAGRNKYAIGSAKHKEFVATIPESLRRELGMSPEAAKVKANDRSSAVSQVLRRIQNARKG
jgi:hypothetical protein